MSLEGRLEKLRRRYTVGGFGPYQYLMHPDDIEEMKKRLGCNKNAVISYRSTPIIPWEDAKPGEPMAVVCYA